MRRERQLRMVRRLVGAGVLGLLFALNLHCARRAPKSVALGRIGPAQNFARLQVSGVLQGPPIRLSGGDACCLIDDGTGTLAVFVAADRFAEWPRAGSGLMATGRLSVGQGAQVRLQVGPTDLLELSPAVPLHVVGRVASVERPAAGSRDPCRIGLATLTGRREVVFWFPCPAALEVGCGLAVEGTLDRYRGRTQLVVRDTDGLRVQCLP